MKSKRNELILTLFCLGLAVIGLSICLLCAIPLIREGMDFPKPLFYSDRTSVPLTARGHHPDHAVLVGLATAAFIWTGLMVTIVWGIVRTVKALKSTPPEERKEL